MRPSIHLMKERAGRYAFIATTVGIGKPIHTIERINSNSGELCYVQVTDTGVVMVKSKDNAIITLYLANITEIQTYFANGVPCIIEAIVKRNMKKGYVKMQNTFDQRVRRHSLSARAQGGNMKSNEHKKDYREDKFARRYYCQHARLNRLRQDKKASKRKTRRKNKKISKNLLTNW